MKHIDARVNGRLAQHGIQVDVDILHQIARKFADTAVILARLNEHKGTNRGDYMTRGESNGDLVVLIARNHKAVTIMLRRSSQTNTAEQLRVRELVDLSQVKR